MQFQITTQIGFRVLPTAQTPPLEHLFLIDTDFEPNGKSETLLSSPFTGETNHSP